MVPAMLTTQPFSYSDQPDPLAPLRGVLLGILIGGALWIDVLLLVRAIL